MKDVEEYRFLLGDGNDTEFPLSSADILKLFGDFPTPSPAFYYFQIACAIVYSTLTILGVVANLIFCCVIWKTEKLHTVTHMLMTNLAVSNLLFLIFYPPYFLSTFVLETNWHFGVSICKASYAIPYVTVTASFYFMCLVAIDRWLAIFRRKQRICSRRGIQLTIGAWLLAGIVASPYFYSGNVIHDFSSSRCGGETVQYQNELLVTTIIVQYAIPLAIMVPAYTHLAYFLYRRPTVGVQSKEKTKKATTRRKRLIFTLIAILAIQVACWMPLFTVGFLHRIVKDLGSMPYLITSTIALLGVLFTPLCYLTNDGFTHQIRRMFPFIFKKKPSTNSSTAPETSRRLLAETELMTLRSSSNGTYTPALTPKTTRVVTDVGKEESSGEVSHTV